MDDLPGISEELPFATEISILFSISFFLKDYGRTHPNVTILDPPDAIKHVLNRQSMLEDVANLKLPECDGTSRIAYLHGFLFKKKENLEIVICICLLCFHAYLVIIIVLGVSLTQA